MATDKPEYPTVDVPVEMVLDAIASTVNNLNKTSATQSSVDSLALDIAELRRYVDQRFDEQQADLNKLSDKNDSIAEKSIERPSWDNGFDRLDEKMDKLLVWSILLCVMSILFALKEWGIITITL